jgi:hypothetical protein
VVAGIIEFKEGFSSCCFVSPDFSDKVFILNSTELNTGISLEPNLKEVERQWKLADFL